VSYGQPIAFIYSVRVSGAIMPISICLETGLA
jgi:hypothetical protein